MRKRTITIFLFYFQYSQSEVKWMGLITNYQVKGLYVCVRARDACPTLYWIDRKPINICFTTRINISVFISSAFFFFFFLCLLSFLVLLKMHGAVRCVCVTYHLFAMLMRINSVGLMLITYNTHIQYQYSIQLEYFTGKLRCKNILDAVQIGLCSIICIRLEIQP